MCRRDLLTGFGSWFSVINRVGKQKLNSSIVKKSYIKKHIYKGRWRRYTKPQLRMFSILVDGDDDSYTFQIMLRLCSTYSPPLGKEIFYKYVACSRIVGNTATVVQKTSLTFPCVETVPDTFLLK